MREAEVYVPFGICEPLGFDTPADPGDACPVRDVSVVAQDGPGCVQTVTVDEPIDGALADTPGVQWVEHIDRDDSTPTYLLKVVSPAVPDGVLESEREAALQSVAVEDGGVTQTFVGDQEALGRTVEFFRSLHAGVSLRRLSDYEAPADGVDGLTNRQREVLETAYDLGYYEVPRETTADEIARELDIDRSTVTEHLQRAERTLVAAAVSE